MRKTGWGYIRIVSVVSLLVLLHRCSFDVAGGGTSTGDAQVVGKVYIRKGFELQPASNAIVSFVHYKAHPDTSIERSIVTDSTGFYSLSQEESLPVGVYNVFAEKSGKKAYIKRALTKENFIRADSIPDTIAPITLHDAVSLQGVVNIDPSIKKENVLVLLLGTPYTPITPDQNGNMIRDSIASGEYDFTLILKNFRKFTFVTELLISEGAVSQPVINLNSSFIVLDSCEGDDQNNLWGYWYVYDDNGKYPNYMGTWDSINDIWIDSLDGGNSAITNFVKISDDDYEEFKMTDMTIDGGNTNGTPGHAAKVAFKMGTIQPHSTPDSTFGNYIGMGTQLVSDDSNKTVIDIGSTVKITYWAKASVPVQVVFQVITEQGHFDLYGTYYQIIHAVDTDWKQYTVYLREKDPTVSNDSLYLTQPEWAFDDSVKFHHPEDPLSVNSGILPLDISKANAIQWMITVDENPDLDQQTGALWIDDITIDYYNMDVLSSEY